MFGWLGFSFLLMRNPRCINIDWLEVHAREGGSIRRDAYYYSAAGYNVKEREYGTRVYRQMFTICTPADEPLLEIRRDPASQGFIGIHDSNECHIRLANRSCYFDNAAMFLQQFLLKHGYTDIRISRIDLCLDFAQFDLGDDPAAFVRRYFKHRYSKINQGRICSHGADTWTGQEWNSISWGSKSSCVTTKLYNKTMELYDAKLDRYGKPYIREAWYRCGLIDDIQRVTKDGEKVDIWRVEFTLRSSVKNWIPIHLGGNEKEIQSLKNTLDVYSSREKILIMFASLAQHYFHFKKYETNKRKDRCKDKVLFSFGELDCVYKVGKPETALGSGNTFKAKYNRLLEKLTAFQTEHWGAEIFNACDVLINAIREEEMRSNLSNPWSDEELMFMKQLIAVGTRHKDWSYDVVCAEVKRLLNITDRVIDKF